MGARFSAMPKFLYVTLFYSLNTSIFLNKNTHNHEIYNKKELQSFDTQAYCEHIFFPFIFMY